MAMKAIIVQSPGKIHIASIPQPKLRPDYVKVKVTAVALNPTDWKHIDNVSDAGSIIGCDFAGIVEEIGAQVTTRVSKGEHICGFVSGGNVSNHEDGAFAEYLVVKDGLFIKSDLQDDAAATLGLGLVTCGQALYQTLDLPWPDKPKHEGTQILIYGGSTATGMIAIQLAKLSGLKVIATASKHNFQLLKDFGADEVFDYKDSDCGFKIREFTGGKLYYVFDTIANAGSVKICAEALMKEGGFYTALQPVSFPRDDVKTGRTLAYTALGEEFMKGGEVTPAKPDHYQFAKSFMACSTELVAKNALKPPVFTIKEGGLNGVLDGIDELREGKVSGTKLVYPLS